MDTAIALYGAVIATAVAGGQLVSWWKRRTRIKVDLDIMRRSISEGDIEYAHGTPVQVEHDHDVLWQEALIQLTVWNEGGEDVQIIAVLVESISERRRDVFQVVPSPLPQIMSPGTRVEIIMQKEPLDLLDNVSFFGVIDALGRRHAPDNEKACSVVRQSWALPTRARWYRRRDDPTAEPVLAYQVKDRHVMNQAPLGQHPPTPFVRRQNRGHAQDGL